MINSNQILRNISTNYVTLFLGIVISFFLTPFIIHSLGKSYYGIWLLINSLIGYMSLLDFGIRPAVNRFVAKYVALEDKKGINQVVSSAYTVLWVSALLILILTGILVLFFNRVFNIENVDPVATRWSLAIVGVAFSLGMPMQIFGGLLSGFERYDLQNMSSIIAAAVRTLLIVCFLSKGYSLIALALITAATGFLEYLVEWRLARRVFPDLTLILHRFEFKIFKEIVAYGLFSFIIGMSLILTYYTDLAVIGVFATASAVAVYSIPGSMITYSRQLVSSITRVFTPVMTKSHVLSEQQELQGMFLSATRYTAALSMGLAAGMAVFGGDFIKLWVGAEFSSGYAVLLVLLIPQIFGLSQQMSAQVLFGMGRNDIVAYLELGSALANLVLSVILVQYMGMVGVAWGTAIPLFVTHTIVLPCVTCRRIKLPIRQYFLKGYLGSIGLSAGFALLLYSLRGLLVPGSWLSFASLVCFAAAVYGIGCWSFILDVETKARMGINLMPKWAPREVIPERRPIVRQP